MSYDLAMSYDLCGLWLCAAGQIRLPHYFIYTSSSITIFAS